MSSKTVLLVEDDACIALDEGNALKRLGYKVFITDSGENAVELAANIATVGLILMDIDLGKGIDGIEAARRILATQELPIVFLTSHSEQGTAAQVSGIRHYGYVLKNSGNFVLQTTIEMAFELFEAFRRIKEKNETLVQEQFLLNAILNNSPDYIYFKDGMGRFIRASKALAQALDVADPSRLIGKTDFEYLTKGRAQQAYEDEQAIIRTGEPLIKEEKEVGTNHPDLWVLTEKMPLRDEQGKIIGTFGVSRDITERKRAEKRAEYHIRLYATLSKVYRTIACIKSQAELFDKICETIVITGKFRAAWIGVLDGTCAGIDILAHNAQCNGSLPPESEIYREIQLANSPFAKALKRTCKALGSVRDLNVFNSKTESYLQSLAPFRRRGMEPLLAAWKEEHEARLDEMRDYLEGRDYSRFKERFSDFLETPDAGTRPTATAKAEPAAFRVRHVLPALLFSAYARLRAFDECFAGNEETPLLRYHQLRIAAKRLRYTLEFFIEPLGPAASPLIERTRRLQDHLGNLQDAVIASDILRSYLRWGGWRKVPREELPPGDIVVAPEIAEYFAFRQVELRELLDSFPKAWADLSGPDFFNRLAILVATQAWA